MANYVTEVKAGKLIITVDLAKTMGKSKSGKSTLIASSKGIVGISVPGKAPVSLNLNVFTQEK